MGKARSADSAVYKRPLTGGEAIDDDVEGHSMMTHATAGPKVRAAGGPKLHATGSKARVSGDDEDTEGHSMKASSAAGGPSSD